MTFSWHPEPEANVVSRFRQKSRESNGRSKKYLLKKIQRTTITSQLIGFTKQ